MRRVAVVITARPSYSRIRSALVALRARGADLMVVAAASALVTRFGRVVDEIRRDGFHVADEVPCVVEEDSLANSARSTGLLTMQLAGTFERLRPDVVVTIADRHETIATAIAASYQNIPLCHVQGGEVTGSIDDKVRNAVTQLADVHCVSTDSASLRVACMTGSREIHVTGCPSIDLAAEVVSEEGAWGMHDGRIYVLQHPVTDEADQAGAQMRATIDALRDIVGVRWFWPGEDAAGSAMAKELRLAGIQATRNLPPREFLAGLSFAACIVGNSSVGIRECSFLGIPAVNVGTRQQGRERGANVVDVPHDPAAIRAAVLEVSGRRFSSSTLYGDGRAGERIADVLLGRAAEVAA